MKVQVQQIFEYLLAVKNMTTPPIRDYRKYDFYWKIDELPVEEGCYLFGKGEDEEAWLEIHKQTLDLPPKPDISIKEWLKTDYTKENIEPEVYEEKEYPPKRNQTDPFEKKKFVDDLDRVKNFNQWLGKWHAWSNETKIKKQIQSLYGFFFILFQRLEREGEVLELAFGHGIIRWKHSKGNIYHPLLITRLELSFNSKEGIFTLIPKQQGTVMEIEMLDGIDLPNMPHLHKIRKNIEEFAIEPIDANLVFPLYKDIVHLLHPEGKFDSDYESEKTPDAPIIIEKPILFLRKKSGQLWKEELQNIINEIKQGLDVPNTLLSLVEKDILNQNENEKREWKSVGEDLLFPLPANEDQKEIARRLANNVGITVQGPPGTGKSHTIANLISHLLAHGKRVLVTSHTERALKVLTDKIPEEIRPLCVSVLGGDARSLQEVEDSIRSITNQMASLDVEQLGKEINQTEEQLKSTRRRIEELKLQLREAAEKEHEDLIWEEEKINRLIAAKKLKETESMHSWLPDKLQMDQKNPLSEEQMRRMWMLRGELTKNQKDIINQYIPDPSLLLAPEHFSKCIDEGIGLKRKTDETKNYISEYKFPLKRQFIEEIRPRLNLILKEQEILKTPYLQRILEDFLGGGEREKTWIEFLNYIKDASVQISHLSRSLTEYEVSLPDLPIHQLKEDISLVENRLKQNKKLNGLYFITSGRKHNYLSKHPIINKKLLQTLDEVKVVKNHLLVLEKRERLVRMWNTTLKDVEGPVLEENQLRFLSAVDHLIQKIEATQLLSGKLLKLRSSVSSVTLPANFMWNNFECLSKLNQDLQTAEWHVKREEWLSSFNRKLDELKFVVDKSNMHPVGATLLNSFQYHQKDNWFNVYNETKSLIELQEKHREFYILLSSLRKTTPNWADLIEKSLGNEIAYPHEWEAAWKWNQLNTWVCELERYHPERIEVQIQEEQGIERKLIEMIVAKSTWKNQLSRITGTQKRALLAWKQKIKRIGKGKSKYIAQYIKEARQEMDEARSAIPVWIMPIDRVIENLSVTKEKFDVVIVDESSQSDLFSLAVLLRAKKAVIVGDDEQISPPAVGVNQEEVRTLIERYLQGVPQANSLDMQASLYDVGIRLFTGGIMLKEHFRCVPEIIQFSNDLSYNGEIIPLRLPTEDERIGEPIIAKRVPGYRSDGTKVINEVEAEEIVKDIKMLIQDSRYKNLTMGVISLQGKDQANFIESMIRNEIGEEEIVKRKIICGDSYSFQGDERDIIFLSMVIANNVRFAALVKKDAQQRFNVAASRAKNQMRLYHSVDLSDLNINDVRFRLLQYCQNPLRVVEQIEEAEKLCDSQFEIDVLRMVVARGYRVRPQVKVGRYRIDLVVEGLKNRLAVECDGDRWHGIDKWEEDMERQRILERAGWKFWRVRGSSFYRDRKKAMESLWFLLDEMGLEKETMENASGG